MSTKKDDETKTVLRMILILMIIFYLTSYIVALVSAAALQLYQYQPGFRDFNAGYLPFWHYQCGLGEGNAALASWLSQIFPQIILCFAIFFIVRSTKHAWDYSVTISFFHFCITCIVTQAFPTTWQWWVTLIVSTIVVSVASELMCYFLHDLKEIEKN